MVGGWRLFTAAFSRLAAGRGLLPFGQRQRASRLVRAWLPCAGHERRCSRYTGPELRVRKLVRTAETHPLHRIRSSRTLLSGPESCPSLFLAYGRALFVVLRIRPQLRGRSNNVQVVDIKSSLNPPTAIYSGTRHLDCGWGPKEFDQLPPPKASTVRGITRKLASPVQLSEPLGRRSTGSNAAEKVSSLDKALLHFIPVFGLTPVRHDHGVEISRGQQTSELTFAP